jgi:hypothetical protein
MIHKVLMPELLAIRYGYHRAANAQFISNRLSQDLLLADFVEKVGIHMGWGSDAACLVEVRAVVRCILWAFSGSLDHLRPW